MTENIIESFYLSPLLREIKPEFLQALAKIAVKKNNKKDTQLFIQDQKAEGFYLICSGTVKIFRIGNDGREQTIHIFRTGETVGEVPVFQGTDYPACATALAKSELIYFPANKFIQLCRQQPELLLNMLAILSQRLRKFVELIDDLTLKDVTSRLAKYIIKNKTRKDDSQIVLEQSKTSLASRLGTIPATLSRTLKKLQDLKIIEVDKNLIKIIDEETLERIADGEKAI